MAASRIEGIGLGLRLDFATELAKTERSIDWLEVVPENWLDIGGGRERMLAACVERWKIVPHSITMSIGGLEPLDAELFGRMEDFCERVDAPFWSDHICFARANGKYVHDLLPLPFSEEALEHTIARIERAKKMFSLPLVFENPTYYSRMPGSAMEEATFLRTIFEETDCQMLLDVNNVYVNSKNHGFDPYAFIDAMPLDRVAQIHLAGHTPTRRAIVDTHIGPIIDEVWRLYRYTLERSGAMIPTLIEWDSNFPGLDAVIDEVDRARSEARRALSRRPQLEAAPPPTLST